MLRFVCFLALVGVLCSKPTPDFILEYAKKFPNTGVNDAEYGDYFEGDIMVPEGANMNEVNPMNIIPGERYRWTNNILYYDVGSEYSSSQRTQIEAAINEIVTRTRVNGQTCVQIVPRTTQTNYVYIRKYSGCTSYVGMLGGAQQLSLVDGCFVHGTIMHEFLHAFGFHHEHTREDRDNHIFVNYANIQPGMEYAFDKREEGKDIDYLGTPYDLSGVMHYGAYGFGIDPSVPTIIPHDPNAPIGQRSRLSDIDIERVQIAYRCISAKDSKYFKHLAE